jgi:hypothetical protein
MPLCHNYIFAGYINCVHFMPRSHVVYFGLFGLFFLLWHHLLLSSILGTEEDDHSVPLKYTYVGRSVVPNSKLLMVILLGENEQFRTNFRNL